MENSVIIIAVLLLLSIVASKVSDRFGIPALLVFLALGMLAGSEGLGGIYFDDPSLAQAIGVVALSLILFSGGLSTQWQSVRPIFAWGFILATLGVCVTALVVGLFSVMVFDFTIMEGLLLGAIVSSTDAAAVFSILRSKGISLRGQLKPLLEFESGSNDPMAVFLTIGMIQVLTQPESSLWDMVRLFALQMSIGLAAGYVMARVTLYLVNRLKLGYEGLYPVLTLSLALLTYGLSDKLGGNGFLAVYITGIIAGNSKFIHKRSLLQFHDGLAWLMQITMFLTLGLLVFPSHLLPVMGLSLLIAVCLILVARPAGVFLSLLPSPFSFREKAFISWVGLRGAVPIILATFPFLAGILQADLLFNVVFFVVLTSVLLQGTTIQYLARWLRVDAPLHQERVYPIEFNPDSGFKSELNELIIPAGSQVVGKKLFELKLPPECLIVLIVRGNEYVLPSGQTFLNDGDALLVLADRDVFGKVVAEVNTPRPA
ncbi:MAG TPA: potassium/proton antiporter [Deltaproteobacteria bacterium]|nr:potassium/proton antiporter [Deltaproteobacteria bacterium]HPA75614.1 potassium/proton antiporter [Deltaproteobacteria bacterium]HPR03887.1 potassium/proton antiporter [Deltaproteobacteria bacterium]HQM71989.1 potassium/proton antiporter [Deltaproteobacteria bacterium]HQO60401.1 potassium/proton antiporter [Deltaproteobacteria bacterium]